MSGDNRFLVGVETQMAQPASQGWAMAMEDLDHAIGRLEEEIHIISSVLGPISRPEMETRGQDPGDTMPNVSDVGQRVYRQAGRVNSLAYTLRTIRERIDL